MILNQINLESLSLESLYSPFHYLWIRPGYPMEYIPHLQILD
jgi:hypothetical protein